MRVGAAGVYTKHANIIVNLGNARSADVLALAGRMQDAVAERFDTRLEPEVRHLPPSGAAWGILG
jgi:UDP-N-acetylmuramate dehydrogenase